VRALLQRYPPESPGFRTIGYRELLAYLQGTITLEEAVRAIQRNTKVYLRRQIYFFRKLGPIRWVPAEEVLAQLRKALQEPPE